jgi:uncharacterized protein YjbI with pentapeptide repeats
MGLRHGFARQLWPFVLSVIIAGTFALLARARPAQSTTESATAAYGGENLTQLFPSTGILDAHGKAWSLSDLQPGTVLEGADVRDAHWRGVRLRGVTFRQCRLGLADLRGADLTDCRFVRCDLVEACLDHACLARTTWIDVSLYDGGLFSADLRRATLIRVDLCDCSLGWARLDGADFTRCDPERLEPAESIYDRFTRWPAGFDH